MIDIILITFCGIFTTIICTYRMIKAQTRECKRTILLSRTIGFIAKDNNYNLRK